MNTPYILVVDDDAALLQALPHMVSLRIHGVKVDTAHSAIEALEQIQSHDYDVIVSDMKLPGMDGLELLQRIRQIRPQTPTIMITGFRDQSLLIEAMKSGAYDFMQKPLDRVSFVAALHRAIQARQLQRQLQQQQQLLLSYRQVLKQVRGDLLDDGFDTSHLPVQESETVKTPSGPFQPPYWLVS